MSTAKASRPNFALIVGEGLVRAAGQITGFAVHVNRIEFQGNLLPEGHPVREAYLGRRDLRVERAAVAATELSLARCAELYMAVPVVDHGTDLHACHADPFRVARIQVKGATGGLKVFLQYGMSPITMSYVLDPLGADTILLTGGQAWNLPAEYIAQGGKASGHNPEEGPDCRFPGRPRLLSATLGGTRPRPSGGWSSSTSPLPQGPAQLRTPVGEAA